MEGAIWSPQLVLAKAAAATVPGVSSFVAPPGYPTSAFSSYYPAPTNQQPQPRIRDPISNLTWPLNLTDPDSIPSHNDDPIYLPQPIVNLSTTEQTKIIDSTIRQVLNIVSSPYLESNCSKCIAALAVGQSAAQLAPRYVPDAFVSLCKHTKFHSDDACEAKFGVKAWGAIWTQVLAFADVSNLDGQYICNSLSSSFCAAPTASPLDIREWIPKPKPADYLQRVPKPSGKRLKVLHMSDFHLDPRYKVESEANCTSGLCCRSNNFNVDLPPGVVGLPSSLYGYFKCDTPYDLGLAALQAVGPLTGTSSRDPLAWTIYTGDLVAHDSQTQVSQAYVKYTEDSIFAMFKKYLSGPVFAALGNHDTSPIAIDSPHSLPGPLGEQMSWNYDHVAALWQHEGWISADDAKQARLHYGSYSIKNHYGLRMITFNSDFWYKSNYLNFINASNPDVSGTFRFMIEELQDAEDRGERVWIFAHVLSGWDGSNPLPNPTNLFYQIVERYSPHVIANVFFGHTHEDQVMIYYSDNATVRSQESALNTGWIGPSITPLTNLNSGFRMYEVDSETFDIYEAYTWYSDVSVYHNLSTEGPTFQFEYSTRDVYSTATNWPAHAPLNSTFWHRVTEAMEHDPELVSKFNTLQGKTSIKVPNCTSAECAAAKICYMRSGSASLGRECLQVSRSPWMYPPAMTSKTGTLT